MLMNTKQQIIQLRKQNPCATLKFIGDKVGVSRERVRQVLNKANQPTRHYSKKTLYTCLYCSKETTNKYGFCNKECKHQYNMIPLVCDNCGVVFYRIKSQTMVSGTNKYKGSKVFCKRKCMYQYERKYPFYDGSKTKPSKYNLYLILELYNKGYSYNDMAKQNNTTVTTISTILNHLRKQGKITTYRYNRK